ncbi:cadmium-translocating P-type ATPase [Pseudohoeflea suaedae]|uniref:Cadmium-translocating P-type ATPase n=1 Tax=Pseudohoeflea suaedae TaxID=877384 RepID=A0A4R5PJR6_9HYPH|nr:heavy metal translocating P-type ATPase [Pseudohoeflea suaedae]TDH35929.1 cadmium-translocating P-type ATPase [Pseudohoeflea suaedae]
MSCCAAGTESASELDALRSALPVADELALASRSIGDGLRQCDLIVPGVHCGACIALLEKELPKIEGIERARVNLSTRRIALVAEGEGIAAGNTIAAAVQKMHALGYSSHLPGGEDEKGDPVLRELLRSLAVAGFASMNVMLLSVSVWSGAEDATRDMFHLISALIAGPAILYAGRVFYRSAWQAVSHGRANMDVPITLGVLLAYAISMFETFSHGEHAYFDASLTLLFFLLGGRTLDHMMRERARSAVRNLANLSPRGAIIVGENGSRDFMSLDEIRPGMKIALAAGERTPVDGIVAEGVGDMDFSLVNGEGDPVRVEAGMEVPAGTLNLTGSLIISATRAARDSFLAEMVSMMEAAESGRAGYRRLADRASSIYAPVVHLLALLTFFGWIATTGDWRQATLIAVSVLIITCPCALGLAVPVVQVIAAGRLFENGIMVKDGSAMERLAEADYAVFDKTGTLTRGRPVLLNAADIAHCDLALGARIAQHSLHPLSKALAAAGQGIAAVSLPSLSIREIAGEGLEAVTPEGRVYRLGRAGFALSIDRDGDDAGSEVVLSRDGDEIATFRFSDSIRAGAGAALASLEDRGIRAEILSGDRERPVAVLAGQLGVTNWLSRARPAEKVARLEALRAEGRKVIMVGDGLNDAPALSAAHVSMAPASAADVGRQAADFVFLHESLEAVPVALSISRRANRLIRQNFALAILYNLIAVPLAILGHASPLVAAVAMSSSSVIVVLNSMRLKWRHSDTKLAVDAVERRTRDAGSATIAGSAGVAA